MFDFPLLYCVCFVVLTLQRLQCLIVHQWKQRPGFMIAFALFDC